MSGYTQTTGKSFEAAVQCTNTSCSKIQSVRIDELNISKGSCKTKCADCGAPCDPYVQTTATAKPQER